MSGEPPNPLWQKSSSEPAQPPANWYTDPGGSGGQRYWDGAQWTDAIRPAVGQPPAPLPAYCRACGQSIDPRASICPGCGVAQAVVPAPYYAPPGAKSPGLAVLFSFLWLGAGHFYADDTGAGAITLAVVEALLVLMSLTIFLIPLAFIIWLPLFIWAAVDSRNKVLAWNHRRGFVTP